MHCWQGDDVIDFDQEGGLSGGIQTTGDYPSRARTFDELKADFKKAMSLCPGKKRIDLHASYAIFTEENPWVDRDKIEYRHFKPWVDWAHEQGYGIGLESYTVESNEFYLAYASTHEGVYDLLDTGHFHPTENVADKISALLPFFDKIPLHVTRSVRWDSDHVILFDEATKEMAQEIARCEGAWDAVIIGLDFFDASINRIGAWATGVRAMQKSLLYALLQPNEALTNLQDEYRFTEKMMLAEAAKSMPFDAVWDEYCARQGVPNDLECFPLIDAYEKKVLPQRS